MVFCKSSLLCKLWALLGHGARIAHQERSLTTNLNAANNYKAASCVGGWGWSQEQDGFMGGWIHGFCNGFVLFCLFFCPSSPGTFLHHLLGQTLWQFLQFSQQSWWVDNILPQKTTTNGVHRSTGDFRRIIWRQTWPPCQLLKLSTALDSSSPCHPNLWRCLVFQKPRFGRQLLGGFVSTSAGACHGWNRTNGFNGWEDVTPNKVTR